MFGHPMVDDCPVDVETGEILPVVTIVTDNGGPFRSFRFEAFIELHPELRHVRTKVRSPGQNGSRERGFGTLKYERLFIDEIDDAVMLASMPRSTSWSTTPSGPTRLLPGTGHGRCTWAWPTHHPDISSHRKPANSLTRDTRFPPSQGRLSSSITHANLRGQNN